MPKGHAVIDGSNLATEGRNEPSLKQLDEAVRAISAEYDFENITVVVDATFEHRVAKSETKAARSAIDDGDIITPPAGVIGRGDAFILLVADRAGAVVFSNDSFQEFHGTYGWLFDEGRLIGGKPVPGVGWIYVDRSPVRGPVSRRATADSRKSTAKKAPAVRKRREPKKKEEEPTKEAAKKSSHSTARTRPAAPAGDGSNDADLWNAFKSDYPVGSTIAATVDRFSSHGAYGLVDGVVVYLPNRLLGEPPPTKARDVVELGNTMDFIVHRYDDERHGIDAGLIPAPGVPAKPAKKRPARKTAKKAAAKKTTKRATKTSVAKTAKQKAAARPAAKRAPAKKQPAKKAARKQAPAKRATTKTGANRTGPAGRVPTKRATKKKAPARRVEKRQ